MLLCAGARDVRVHLRSMRTQILAGVVICFTAVIPQNASFNVSDSPPYQLALQVYLLHLLEWCRQAERVLRLLRLSTLDPSVDILPYLTCQYLSLIHCYGDRGVQRNLTVSIMQSYLDVGVQRDDS